MAYAEQAFAPVITEQAPFMAVYPGPEPEVDEAVEDPAPSLITVVGAAGGVGRSSIALLMAWLCAQSGLATLLVEADLQFGAYASWLGLDDGLPNLGTGEEAAPIGLAPNLGLLKAPLFPEDAENISDAALGVIEACAFNYDLVIADTGNFWNGLTAELLKASDLFVMITDQRLASVVNAMRAVRLCHRLEVPIARMHAVSNRWTGKGPLSEEKICGALGTPEITRIPDGKQLVERLLSVGEVEQLIEEDNAMVRGVHELLGAALPRVGYLYSEPPRKPKIGFLR